MAYKYLQFFPKPMLADLVAGKWLPIIGAGFSRNALLPSGKQMPLWPELGTIFGGEIDSYSASSALDAISAYEHEFGRPKLIERLADALFIMESRPGRAHHAFCSIPFDIVCTTNFDFLLERQYDAIPRNCTPLVDEEQLSINGHAAGVDLLKLHGDLRHPVRLVATETDYDRFLASYPMLATYLANLLITRTAVLIGYSLDDPDFRQIWQVVGDRLGKSRRMAYAILVGAKPTDIARFDRRGVKVINLPAGKGKYGDVLADAFKELHDYWPPALISSSQVKEEQSLRELSLPKDAQTRLCFFSVPLKLLSFYRDKVFPLVKQNGFVPITADDVVSPGDTILPKIEALIGRSLLMVVDITSEYTRAEYHLAVQQIDPSRILLISPSDSQLGLEISKDLHLLRPDIISEDPEQFLSGVQEWFRLAAERYRPLLFAEPIRLFTEGEYRAAVIAAISLLENILRQRVDSRVPSPRMVSLRDLLENANNQGLLGNTRVDSIMGWLKVRNEVVHGTKAVTKAQSEQIVYGVQTVLQNLL
jgi:hypothetical protein